MSSLPLRVALLLAATCLLVWRLPRPDAETTPVPAPAAAPPTAVVRTQTPHGSVASGGASFATPDPDPAAARRDLLARLAYGQEWDGPQPEPLARFRDWTARFLAAAPDDRPALEREGVSLARERRAAFRRLIAQEPARAFALTPPAPVRRALPAAVQAELERRVAGTGELAWHAALPAPGPASAGVPSVRQVVVLGGATYQAHVYGRRAGQPTLEGASLHGLALDGDFAVHESPLRVLDPGEIPPRDGSAPACPVSARPATSLPAGFGVNLATLDYVEAEGRVWGCCAHDDVLAEFEARLLADAAAAAPGVAPVGGAAAGLAPPRAAEPATPRTLGTKRLLVIRVDFSDFPGEPVGADTLATRLNGSIREFFEDCSFGQASLTATITDQVYRLPATGASYATANNSGGLHTAARNAAAADYRLADFNLIMVAFRSLGTAAVPGSQFTWAGLASVGGTNSWINAAFTFGTMAHELGHNFGLKHASLWTVTDGNPVSRTGTSREYGDPFDVMGNNPARDGRAHFNHRAKNQVGWLPDAAVRTVTTSGVYRVYRHDSRSAPRDRTLALRVFRDGVRWYWIGLRQALADNAGLLNGANVLWAHDGLQETQLLDCTTPGNSPNDSALAVGATLDDSDYGVRLRPVERGGAGDDAWIDVELTLPSAPSDLVAAWGGGQDFRSTPTAVTNVPFGTAGVKAIAVGTSHALALRPNGTVIAWGDSQLGQTTLPALTDIVEGVAAAGNVSGLVTRGGAVHVWGLSTTGHLEVPAGLAGVRQLALGATHALALQADGTVVAWGGNSNGQTNVPAGLADVVEIVAGDRTSIARRRDGTVIRWGANFSGVAFPTGLAGITALATTGGHALALRADGTVVAWGSNGSGQCNVPAGLDNVVAIAAGSTHSLALRSDGTVVGWGSNTSGRATAPVGLPRARALAAGGTASFAVVGDDLFITTPPRAATVAAGGGATLAVEAAAPGALAYQWRKDGVPIAGATGATLTVAAATAAAAGAYDVVVTASGRSLTTSPVRLTVTEPSVPGTGVGRIANLSIRTRAGTAAETLIVGFVVGGAGTAGTKPLLVRAVGPALGTFGVAGALADPRLELFQAQAGGQSVRVQENDNWLASDAAIFASVGAFPLAPNSLDAAISQSALGAGAYSAQVSGVGGATGVVLAEIYDATPEAAFTAGTRRLINVSARTVSGTGADTLIAGFTISGAGTQRVLVRAVGPALSGFGVTGVLANPRLELFQAQSGGQSVRIQENDDWGAPASGAAALAAAFQAVGAFALPANSRDAALVATLAAGSYTAQVSGAGSITGVALVEIYEVP